MGKRWSYSFEKRKAWRGDTKTMKQARGITVIIPCYNEYIHVPKTLDYLMDFLEENFSTFEIILISDGSTDLTPKVTDNIIKFNEWESYIKLIEYKENKGKGYAIRQGLLKARFDLLMLLDCDLSVKPENLLETMKQQNMGKMFFLAGQRIQVIPQSRIRLFLGLCFRTLVKWVTGVKMKDTQCPYKILNKIDIPKSYYKNLKIDGFAYDVELIKLMQKSNVPIMTQSVEYFNDDNSTVTFRKILRMGLDLLVLGFRK